MRHRSRLGGRAPLRGQRKALGALAPAAVLAGLVLTVGGASAAGPNCKGGEARTVETGIVKAIGCWVQSTENGDTVYVARHEDQDEGIDLNGFVITGPAGGGLKIDPTTGEVESVALAEGNQLEYVQLNSRGWPAPGKLTPLGEPLKLGFVAPASGKLLLEDIRFGGGPFARALAGFSPAGNVETPVEIEEGGRGAMNLSLELTGAFSLKNQPQSVRVDLPTISGQGTKLDGFEIKLKEIDAFEVITINDFLARYSAAKQELAAAATATIPFAADVGFGAGFDIQEGELTEVTVNVHGLQIPIGAPPAGFVTDLGGGFRLRDKPGHVEVLAIASIGAALGPDIPTPWGDVAPVKLNAKLEVGDLNNEFFFEINGGVEIFRLPVGNVYLAIYSNAGVKFGAGIGIGFPSYRNNPRDPFYIGARIGGWVSKREFQFEGEGSVALIGIKIFKGQILVNNTAAGACWRVLGVPGGAVYVYGARSVRKFGVGCGLDHYKEKFPGGARVSAGRPQTIHLDNGEVILEVKGAGKAPRFALRSARGRVLRTPVARDAVRRRDNAFFVDEETDTTYVVLPHPEGVWTVAPYSSSVPITSLKSGRRAPKEHVEAKVRGRGSTRTLVWRSLNRPHTRLAFTELLPGGLEIPILNTDRANGRHRFRVRGGHFGQRRLRVVVIHGYASRQAGVVDRYMVRRPPRLPASRRVRAWRSEDTVQVRWARVRGARGYLVEVSMRQGGKRVSNYVRRTAANRRRIAIPGHPGGGRAVARVFALNATDALGHPGRRAFLTNPTARTLRQAASRAVESAAYRHGGVALTLRCPENGHCQTVVELRRRGRVLSRTRLQQVPDTFHPIRIELPPAAASALRRGSDPGLHVVVRLHRAGESVARVKALR
jgi:hypothetical protein